MGVVRECRTPEARAGTTFYEMPEYTGYRTTRVGHFVGAVVAQDCAPAVAEEQDDRRPLASRTIILLKAM